MPNDLRIYGMKMGWEQVKPQEKGLDAEDKPGAGT